MNPTAPQPISRPSLALLGTEPWRAAYEFAQHKLARRAPVPPGDGHPVIIFPGLGTDGAAVAPLRDYCDILGYSAMDWGRGFNTGPQGDIDTWLAELAEHVSGLLDGHSQRATLIGWSLGGIYARELGKLMAPRLRQVITIGTPFNGTPDHTYAGWLFRLLNGAAPATDPALSERLRTPPPVPTTSIYSRSDGVVAWQSCRHDKTGAQVSDVEVKGSHIGMGWNPAVLQVVAERLGKPQ
ncbi:MAG: alpha/beta hydrolase [Polaromonas sp.]|uniref:alpha/beta hydrolase n=1 Tax=Polaromonas sp. TaxID=1869339 RepID=UPI002489B204|nr:alpha/beta hydrolase [Polaromonas sp.]MDI1236800.1 alpha/beta hydrolase [Polaromonas sp.]